MKFRIFFILLNFFISSSFCLAQNYIVGGSFDYGDLREEWEFEHIYINTLVNIQIDVVLEC
jgi:hypothetical protein